MDYFQHIPKVNYKFGQLASSNAFVDLTAYVQIIDDIKDNIAFYSNYYLKEGYRPDQVSMELYGTPVYHWTFFAMNDKLKEFGWPIAKSRVLEKAKHQYNRIAMQTTSDLTVIMKVGQTVTGSSSGATGIVSGRNLDFGIVYVTQNSVTNFNSSERIISIVIQNDVETTQEMDASISDEYNSPAYYKKSDGERADFDPLVGPGALLTEVTRLEQLTEQNESLRTLKVIKPSVIGQVVSSVKQALNV